ncbi:hypothetical protein Catovirus_1_876 [Catovirus CTV1]|uniref:Uncharacterized protein n=1 Tax=Catovirus CTV1 TaxID=1977631 RepID=A0A1V0SAV0_9VIRU|nr:hypothetical protein Catovirus_1_876 [Catovirus CTV1]
MAKENTKSNNNNKGYVGFVYGSVIKTGWVRAFCVSAKGDINEEYTKFFEYYGPSIRCKYVRSNDPQDTLKKFCDLNKDVVCGNTLLIETSVSSAGTNLKTVSGESTCHNLGPDDEGDQNKSNQKDDNKKKKPVKQADNEENDGEEGGDNEEETKPKKNTKSSTVTKKGTTKVAKVEKVEEDVSDAEEAEAEKEEEQEEETKIVVKNKKTSKKEPESKKTSKKDPEPKKTIKVPGKVNKNK